MKFNEKITILRKKKGWSQEDFASQLNVSRQSVFKWEAGENTPDIEKIKKIAKLFNVSFDLLLDDEKNIEEETKKEIQPTISKPKPKYRKVFDSSVSILTNEHSDIDHGYVESIKRIQSEFFKMQEKGHKDSIAKKHYSKIIRVQHDCLLDFFIDERNSTIGFFFDGAEQFVCPFENFINASISNSGLHTGFTNTPVVGVGVGNKRNSLAVGSMPLGQTRLPGMYYFTISYFDEFGRIKEYVIKFSCLRKYQFYNGMVGSTGANYAFQDALSASTNKMLTSVVSSLEGVKRLGKKIIDSEIDVKPLNYADNRVEVEKGKKQRDALKKELRDLGWKEKQSRIRIGLIIFIVLALAATGGIVACSINKAKQSDDASQTNRAQYVIRY